MSKDKYMGQRLTPAESDPVILVTGGAGFVISNTVKHLLKTEPDTSVVILDLQSPEGVLGDFLTPVIDRVSFVQGDIRERELLNEISRRWPITRVIHAACLTHFAPWERQDPAKYIDINIMGTVNLLEWACTLEGLQQFLYVSTGDVYGEPLSDTPASPQPETGPFNPPELYALTKWAAENITRRYSELFGIPMPTVRLSSVFGPMERPTVGRVMMSMPFHMMRAVLEGRPLRTTAGTLRAGGDFVSAEDVARAIAALVRASAPQHQAYNIANGTYAMVPEVLRLFKEIVPGFEYEVVEPDCADWQREPANRYARWDAYTIKRLMSEFGWRPRPLREQLKAYHDWVMEDPEVRCPTLEAPPDLNESIL